MNEEQLRELLSKVDDTTLLGRDNLLAVNDEVTELAGGWRAMCTALGLLNDDEIFQAKLGVPGQCLKEVLRQWLNKSYNTAIHGLPTWRKLVEAVAKRAGGSNPALAEKIAEKHKKLQEVIPPVQPTDNSNETPIGMEEIDDGYSEETKEVPGEEPKYTAADLDHIIESHAPRSMPSDPADKEQLVSFAKKTVLLLHTCNDTEFWAAVEKLEPPIGDNNQPLADRPVYYPGSWCAVGIFAGYKTAVVKTKQGDQCIATLTTALPEHFPSAKAIIGAGIAYAKDREELKYADIIVSKEIAVYSQFKDEDGDITTRGPRPAVHHSVENVFCTPEVTSWKFYCTAADSRRSSAQCGCIVSAPCLMRNEERKKQLFKYEPKAKGGEMEGWALLLVEQIIRSISVIIIKGVADYGDSKKDDKWQLTAAKAAVDFTHYCLGKTGGSAFKG